MKILIIGAGIIGSIYGWALSEAGNDVVHLVKPARAASFADGMKVDMLDKRKGHKKFYSGTYPIQVSENLNSSDGYELVVVPTKHLDLVNVLRQVAPYTNNAFFLFLTQNWEGTEEIENIVSPSRFLFGDAGAGGGFKAGTLVAAVSSVAIGQIGGRHDPCLRKVEELFKASDFEVTIKDNILHYIWSQYAVNAGWWPAIVKAGSIEAVVSNKEIYNCGLQAVCECLQVATQRGIDTHKYPEISMYSGTSKIKNLLLFWGINYMMHYSEFFKRTSSHALSNPEEIKVFYYDLLNTGKAMGLEMSVLASFEPDIQKLIV